MHKQHIDMEAEATIKIGNDYILFPERHKGNGAFGSVMEGISLKHGGIKIAAKRLNNKAKKQWNEQGKLKRQIDKMTKLHHPNILRLFESVQHNGQVYIVSQLCEFDLNALVAREHRIYNEHRRQISQQHGILVQAKVFDILCQSVDGLYFMNSHGKLIDIVGIMHRDIKPANMLVTKDGVVKISDFDFIKYRDNIQELAIQTQVGSPQYIAPQILMRTDSGQGEYSSKCDIWSLGTMIFELLTGKHLFHGAATIVDVMMLQRNIKTQPIVVPMHYHQFFRDLIPKMIVFEQKNRISINLLKDYLDKQRHNIINSIDPYYKLTKISVTEPEAPGTGLAQSSMMVMPVVPNAPLIQKQRFKQLADTMEKYCTYLMRRAHLLFGFSVQLAEKCKINDFNSRVVIFFAVGFALKTIQELMTLLKSPRMDFPNGDIIFTADIPADFRQQLDKRIQNLRTTLQQQKKQFQNYMNQLIDQIWKFKTDLEQHRLVEVRNIIQKYTHDADWSLNFYLLHLQQFFKKFCRPPQYPFISDGAWLHLWKGINIFHLDNCLPLDQFKRHNSKSFEQFYKDVPVEAARRGVMNFFPDSNSVQM